MLHGQDDPEWYTTEDEDGNQGEGELCEFGQECLDRVAIALGGQAILYTAQGAAVVHQFLNNYPADWRYRHASLICLAQIAEGCTKVMLKEIGSLVDMCLQGLQDPHPRVRWAACQAIGQVITMLQTASLPIPVFTPLVAIGNVLGVSLPHLKSMRSDSGRCLQHAAIFPRRCAQTWGQTSKSRNIAGSFLR